MISDAQMAKIRDIVKDALNTSVEYGNRKALEGHGSSWIIPWPGYHRYHLDWTMEKISKALHGFVDTGSGI